MNTYIWTNIPGLKAVVVVADTDLAAQNLLQYPDEHHALFAEELSICATVYFKSAHVESADNTIRSQILAVVPSENKEL